MLDVVLAERPEDLLDRLAAELEAPGADPFRREWVSVPSLGVRNWVRQELSQRLGAALGGDGVMANVDLPFPGALRWLVLDALRELEGSDTARDPWQVDRLAWSVLGLLADPPRGLDERLRHTGAGDSLAARARSLADLFDRYALHRPAMVIEWLGGQDVGADLQGLDPSAAWQPALFRAVHRRIAERHSGADSPAERLVRAVGLLRSGELDVPLPEQLFVFGQSVTTAELGPLVDALAVRRRVVALLVSPSAAASLECARQVERARPDRPLPSSWAFPRSHPAARLRVQHPLLDGWGTRPLESAMLLGAGGVVPEALPASDPPAASGLLPRVQLDLRRGRLGSTPHVLDPGDRSLQFHGAPGRTRQVEVLRDAVLALLRDVPDLAESDIAVVCPRLEEFAPVLSSVLGPSAARGEQPAPGCVPSLRYTVVDREVRSFNPVLDAVADLLDVLDGRFDVPAVRALLGAPAVRERFALTDEDLSLLSEWAERSNVRWGLDAHHRERWDVRAPTRANSWSAAVDQLLLGVALGDDLVDVAPPGAGPDDTPAVPGLAIGGVPPLPLPDGSLAGAGRLASALHALAGAHSLLVEGGDRPITRWCEDLAAVADLVVAPQRFEDWQRARLDDALSALVEASCDDAGPSPTLLSYRDLTAMLAPALLHSGTRADLGHGSVVVARPSLLAGVPFRVLCILGLDADAVPVGRTGGDDLLASAPMVGDRDPRAEARAELLAALTAARDALVVTYSSRDVRSNAVVPRAVVLDELLDVVAATLGTTTQQLVTTPDGPVSLHPRQAFDPANFTDTPPHGPTGFDPVAREGAVALLEERAGRAPVRAGGFLDHPLAEQADSRQVVELEDLRTFYRHPVKAFFRQRLSMTLPRAAEAAAAELPTDLPPLDTAAIGRELLALGLTVDDPEMVVPGEDGTFRDPTAADILQGFRARGVLPPASIADPEVAAVATQVAAVLAAARGCGVDGAARAAHAVDGRLPDGTRLVGTVGRCRDGDRPGPVHVAFARPKRHHRVSLAIDLLALTLADPTVDWQGVLVMRGESNQRPEPVVEVRRVAGDGPPGRLAVAASALATLVEQYRDGLRSPLPLADKTSWAVHVGKGQGSAWGQPVGSPRSCEANDVHHVRAFGPVTYEELRRGTWAGHRLEAESERLWGTLDRAVVAVDADEEAAA